MGCGVYPVFNQRVQGANFDSDGKLLLSEFDGLNEIAEAHGLSPITSFCDNRPIPEDFDGDPEDLDETLGPWEDWFPIDDGLKCIEAHESILRADAGARALVEMPEEIIEELECLADCLRKAKVAAQSFRLEVG